MGLGLGFGGRKMEEAELEKGEACSYNNNNNDYDASTDPEADLSSLAYIDEKLQHVLGHLQKDFEGGVSAENLGAKFGGYGSFLPTYTRSPSWPHPKSPPGQSCNPSISPKNMASWASGSQLRKAGPPPINFETLPALKASSANDSIEQEVSVTPGGADELASRHESANKKAANMADQKILKVRIKVGSDNLSTQKNAAIYSGLGLGVSPSSSLDESPSGSEGIYRETQEALFESPTSILRFMTSFPLAGEALLSPLPDHLLNLIVKEKILKENISDSGKGDGILLGNKKSKLEEKKDITAERKCSSNRDMRNDNVAVSKKEVNVNVLACEELVSKTLKLPLLSDSYSVVAKVKSKGIERNKGFHDVAEESVEPKLIQEIGWESPRAVSALKVLEEQKTSPLGDISGYVRKSGYNKADETYDSIKADSNTLKGSKALDSEVVDPLNQKVIQRVTSQEQDTMKLPSAKEHASSGGKRKSKGSHSNGSPDAEGAKESLRVGSSLVLNGKQTAHVSSSTNKRETGGKKSDRSFQKAGDMDVFGDIGESEREENQSSYLEILPEDWPKIVDKIEKSTSAIINGHSDILSANKTEGVLVNESCPRATMGAHSNSADVNIAGPSLATAAPVLIKENWVCCDKCQKWRLLPININPSELPEKWLCSMLNWLPAMNRCSVEEEETTKAVFALYHVPVAESQTNLPSNPVNNMSISASSDALQPDQNQLSLGSHSVLTGGRKKHGLKEISNAMDKDEAKSMKKNTQSSIRSGSMTDVTQSPVVDELALKPLIKCDTKTSKMKGKRITDQDSLRAPKKIKDETLHLSGEDWMFDHAGKGGPSTSVGKDQPKHCQHFSFEDSKMDKDRQQVSGKRVNDKLQVSLTDGSLDPMNFDGVEVSRKRKVDERASNHLQGSRVLVKEEFSENDSRKEKKARVSKSGGKDSSASKSSGKLEKKGKHTQKHLSGQDLVSSLSQQRLDGMDSLKRDSGSAQPSLVATSSSSKVSCSHKSKLGFRETKGSSVESVSSSPMRILNPDKLPLTRNVAGKDEYYDAGLFVSDSPRRCSDGEDDGGSDKSGTVRKENTSAAAQHGSLEPSLLDIQDKFGDQSGGSKAKAPIKPSPDTGKRHFMNDTDDYLGGQEAQFSGKSTTINDHHDEETQNENCSNANVSHSRKSGKGSSWPKDGSHNFKSGSVDVQPVHMPSYDVKPRDGRNHFQERPGEKSNEIGNRFAENKKSLGKLSGEIGKRENQSNGQSDAKPVATGGQDVMSTVKQNLFQGRGSEEYTKRFHSENSDHAEIASEGRKPLSLPPSGGTRNEMLTHHPNTVSGSQKGNGADGSQAHDAFKVQKQIKKKVDHQSGSQQNSSRDTTTSGRIRDVGAPSPMRKDSSSQAANNALKEAKDLKHLADRVKSSGSNGESTVLYFQAALKFLHSASLLESCNNESTKHGEMLHSVQIYSSTAKLCEFCAHEYARLKDMAAASLAYKCMEVAYMRVIYSCHANASRDRHELQAALQMVPPGESPASDVDNLNQPTLADKAAFPKGVNSFQASESHVISARNRPKYIRLLNFAQDVNYAMEASRKSRASLAAASSSLGGAKSGEAISSVKKALDFSFQDLEGVLHLIRVAMEAISH
ncbi:cullin-1-like [Hibiscus syriacus]|uniref:Cullin-1-like n=1 Tax=Hibiscus syriacus TaxID=106335 RepID=A0A6A3AHG9_HIBSY|nr:cullin-1-like [Hibiscus syriacus]